MSRRWWSLAPVLGVVVLLVVWQTAVRVFDIRPFVLTAPSDIVAYLRRAPDDFLTASWVTLRHALLGLVFGLVVSFVIGAALAASPFLERAVQPVLVLVQVTPFAAYIGAVVVWLGAGDPPVVFIATLVCVPPFTFAVVAGLRGADSAAVELFASVGATRWEVLRRVRLPFALPSVFTAARYNIGLSLVVAYLVEGSNFADEGLGAIGRRAAANNLGDPLWATIFCVALLGVVGLGAVALAERRLLHWHASQRSIG